MFRKHYTMLFLMIILSGCATAQLPKAPDTYTLTNYDEAVVMGLAKSKR